MAKKGTEISIGKDGFSFKTDGEASERLANAALDFLSPITEGAGFLGTKLRGYRMEAALEAILRAKKICEENNLAINPVPPKSLLQWVEGASMEDVESESSLSDLWASLLVSEANQSEPNTLIYIDILKKLNRTHVQFLHNLLGKKFPYGVGNPSIQFGVRNIDYLLSEPFRVGPTVTFSKFPEIEMKKQIDEANSTPGVELLVVSNGGITDGTLYSDFSFEWIREEDADCEGDRPDLIFNSLAALNLIENPSGEVEILSGMFLNYVAYILTPLGWDFLRACSKNL